MSVPRTMGLYFVPCGSHAHEARKSFVLPLPEQDQCGCLRALLLADHPHLQQRYGSIHLRVLRLQPGSIRGDFLGSNQENAVGLPGASPPA